SYLDACSALDLVNFFVYRYPYRHCGWVEYHVARRCIFKVLCGIHVVHYLYIRSIPDIISAAYVSAEVFDMIPVVIIVGLIAVSPYVHQVKILGLMQLREALCVFHQVMIVMTGRFPEQIVVRECEIVRVPYNTAVFYAAGRKQLYNILVYRAVRVAHAAHGVP